MHFLVSFLKELFAPTNSDKLVCVGYNKYFSRIEVRNPR
jgi:hypothetical protein